VVLSAIEGRFERITGKGEWLQFETVVADDNGRLLYAMT
jgi:hypothetical protein